MNAIPFIEPPKPEEILNFQGTSKDGKPVQFSIPTKEKSKKDAWAAVRIREDIYEEKIKKMMDKFESLDLDAKSYKECLELLMKNVVRPFNEERRRGYNKMLADYFEKYKELKEMKDRSEDQEDDFDELKEFLSHTEKYKDKL